MQLEMKCENGVYSLGSMQAEVILASKPTNGAPPIVTLRTRHPRIIHAEWNTHRAFSRNARSSRAVPIAKMLEEIRNDPFVPWRLGKNQKGMQAGESFSPADIQELQAAWLVARDNAVASAEGMMDFGVHKQIANRLLEPFMWIDVLTTSTSWANFFHLRDHEAAEPHFHDLAGLVRQAIDGAEYQTLEPGQWHLPYVTQEDRFTVRKMVGSAEGSTVEFHEILKKLSVARSARISYAPFDGDGSVKKELERYDLLVGSSPLHASPAEHQATPDEKHPSENEEGYFANERLAGNLGPGWIQLRKTLPGEYVADAA